MALAAGDLIHEFTISTKVGFLPVGNRSYHTLRRSHLRESIEKSVSDLGVPPAAVLLHNPEQSLNGLHPAQAYDYFTDACEELARAAEVGLCSTWGIASWNPKSLIKVLHVGSGCPTPNAMMFRVGLSLTAEHIDTIEQLGWTCNIEADRRWGMSPFAGSTGDPVWTTTDFSALLEPGQDHTPVQAALRLAFELPYCTRLAVGTGSKGHLSELHAATQLEVNPEALDRYFELIADPC